MNRLKEIITRDCGFRLTWIANELGLSLSAFSNRLHGYTPFMKTEIERLGELIRVNPRVLRSEIEKISKNGNGASPTE